MKNDASDWPTAPRYSVEYRHDKEDKALPCGATVTVFIPTASLHSNEISPDYLRPGASLFHLELDEYWGEKANMHDLRFAQTHLTARSWPVLEAKIEAILATTRRLLLNESAKAIPADKQPRNIDFAEL